MRFREQTALTLLIGLVLASPIIVNTVFPGALRVSAWPDALRWTLLVLGAFGLILCMLGLFRIWAVFVFHAKFPVKPLSDYRDSMRAGCARSPFLNWFFAIDGFSRDVERDV